MLPFVAAGVAAGGVSYLFGLPLAYAAFLSVVLIAVAIGVTSALTVKVPQAEPKPRKQKVEKNRRNSTPAGSSTSEENVADSSEKAEKLEDKTELKASSTKRDKERAKKAAKKEAEEKQKQAEAERAAAEEKQKQAAAKAAQKAAEDAEKARVAALEAAEEEEGDDAPAKKNKKKKKKKQEEKKTTDSAPASETKNAAPSKAPAPKIEVKKTEAPPNKTEAKSTEQPVPQKIEEKADVKTTPISKEDWAVAPARRKRPEPTAVTTSTDAGTPELKVETTIDPKSFGVVIGKSGATLKLITEATQTSIDLSSKETGKVTVSGLSRENIDKAIDAIHQLATKGYSVLTHGRRDEGSIVVPPNKRFNVIGPNGQTVKLIQEKLKVRVNLPDRNTSDSTVTVLGDNADVQEAIKCIAELIDQGYSEITHPGCVKEILEVPAGQLGSIIGSQGATVREIQESTGAKINIEGTSVTVVGQQSQVTEAKNKICLLLAPAEPLPADPEWSQEASSRYVDLW